MAKETTAEAPMPLCPPTPSLGHEQVNESGRVELLAAVHGYRRMVRRKVPPFVQAQGVHFFFFPRPAFSTVCALSSLTGRRLKGYVRGRRRLGRWGGCCVSELLERSVVVFLEVGNGLSRNADTEYDLRDMIDRDLRLIFLYAEAGCRKSRRRL